MKKKLCADVITMFSNCQKTPAKIITENDLAGLPAPVQRYLRYAQIIGKEEIRTVYLKQKGFFRPKIGPKWFPLVADEYHTTEPPAFYWHGKIYLFPFIPISGVDLYSEGKGNLRIKFMSLFPLANAQGPECDYSELLRYLSEIIWFPTAWLSKNLEWQPIDDLSAKVTISHCGINASATVLFNSKDQITQILADRYRDDNGKPVLDKWAVIAAKYREVHGFRIPLKGIAIWKLPTGDFSYFRGDITEIEYNKTVF